MAISFRKIFYFILLTLNLSCSNLIYHPDRSLWANPTSQGLEYKEYFVNSFDGTKLFAWDIKSKRENPENLILMFHGNAQNMSAHFLALSWLVKDYSYDLMVFDYRGYGISEGEPSPKGVVEDGLKILQVAYDKFKNGNYQKFIIYAQSLGGAIVLRSLEEFNFRNEINLLVLDSTFRSPKEIAHDKFPFIGKLLIPDDYVAKENLSYLTMPILSIHSRDDKVIPFLFGKKLFNSIPSDKKTFWEIESAAHGNVFYSNSRMYQKKFVEFISNLN